MPLNVTFGTVIGNALSMLLAMLAVLGIFASARVIADHTVCLSTTKSEYVGGGDLATGDIEL